MKLVNFIPTALGTMRSKSVTTSFDPTGSLKGGYTQAFITFYSSKVPVIRVRVIPKFLKGRRSNFLKFGLYLQSGVRYFMTLFEDDNDKLDGTVSTAGHALGPTTAAAVVAKINSSALNQYVSADLFKGGTNVDFTGAGGIGAGDALPMTGGRG